MSEKKPLSWETIRVRLGDLIPNANNPKYSTEETVDRLNDSIDTLGEFQPFVVDSDGLSAVDGHQRLNAWIAHKGENFEVEAKKPSRALTKQEVKKLILYSGKGTHGDWDFDLLREGFEDFELIELGGFDEADFDVDVEPIEADSDESGSDVRVPFFNLNGQKYQITNDELLMLDGSLKLWLDENGSTFGWAMSLVGSDA